MRTSGRTTVNLSPGKFFGVGRRRRRRRSRRRGTDGSVRLAIKRRRLKRGFFVDDETPMAPFLPSPLIRVASMLNAVKASFGPKLLAAERRSSSSSSTANVDEQDDPNRLTDGRPGHRRHSNDGLLFVVSKHKYDARLNYKFIIGRHCLLFLHRHSLCLTLSSLFFLHRRPFPSSMMMMLYNVNTGKCTYVYCM